MQNGINVVINSSFIINTREIVTCTLEIGQL